MHLKLAEGMFLERKTRVQSWLKKRTYPPRVLLPVYPTNTASLWLPMVWRACRMTRHPQVPKTSPHSAPRRGPRPKKLTTQFPSHCSRSPPRARTGAPWTRSSSAHRIKSLHVKMEDFFGCSLDKRHYNVGNLSLGG